MIQYLDDQWITGVVSEAFIDRKTRKVHKDDPDWFTAIHKDRLMYVVTFDSGLTKEFPDYILESMIELAKVKEGTKISLYSYEIDDFFHAIVRDVDDNMGVKNICVEFENKRKEWLDLRRFMYNLVKEDTPKSAPSPSKADQATKSGAKDAPTTAAAAGRATPETAPEKQPEEMEIDKQKESASSSEKKADAIVTKEKSIQTETEKAEPLVTEDAGIQTDVNELCPTEEKGMQTETDESPVDGKPRTGEAEASSDIPPTDTPMPDNGTTEEKNQDVVSTDSKGVQATAETSSVAVETNVVDSVSTGMQTEDAEKDGEKEQGAADSSNLHQEKAGDDTSMQPADPVNSSILSNMKTLKIVLEHKGVAVGEKVIGDDEKGDAEVPASVVAAMNSPIEPLSSSDAKKNKANLSDGVPGSGSETAKAFEEVQVPMKPLKAPKLKKVSKGTKLVVFWEDDGEYYAATVEAVRRAKKQSVFTLEYDFDKHREETMLASREFYLLEDFLAVERYLESTRDVSGALPADNIKRMKKEEEERQRDGNKQYASLSDPFVRYEMDSDSGVAGDLDKGRKDTLPMIKIGTRVAVWWHGEHRFYKGAVTKERTKGKIVQHHIQYDDGDLQWVNFEALAFFVLAQRDGLAPESDVNDKAAESQTNNQDLTVEDGLHDTEEEVENEEASAKKSKKRKSTGTNEDRIPKKSDSQKRRKAR